MASTQATTTRQKATSDYLSQRAKFLRGDIETLALWTQRYRAAWGLPHFSDSDVEGHALKVSAGACIADGREHTERRGGGYWDRQGAWHSR